MIRHRCAVREYYTVCVDIVAPGDPVEERLPAVLIVGSHREVIRRWREQPDVARRNAAGRQIPGDLPVSLCPLEITALQWTCGPKAPLRVFHLAIAADGVRFFRRQKMNAGTPAAMRSTPSMALRGFDQMALATTNAAVMTKSAGNNGYPGMR